MDRIPVYILSGGQSRRFGSDKARALLHGKPLILHVAEALRPYASSVTAVADVAGKYEDLALQTIADDNPHQGPLGGLLAALNHAPSPWLLLASCDFAGLQASWIESLFAHRCDGAEAVAFKSDRWQPLPGLYHRSILPSVEALLKSPRPSLQLLLASSPAVALAPPADWPDHPGVNTPSELQSLA